MDRFLMDNQDTPKHEESKYGTAKFKNMESGFDNELTQ